MIKFIFLRLPHHGFDIDMEKFSHPSPPFWKMNPLWFPRKYLLGSDLRIPLVYTSKINVFPLIISFAVFHVETIPSE